MNVEPVIRRALNAASQGERTAVILPSQSDVRRALVIAENIVDGVLYSGARVVRGGGRDRVLFGMGFVNFFTRQAVTFHGMLRGRTFEHVVAPVSEIGSLDLHDEVLPALVLLPNGTLTYTGELV